MDNEETRDRFGMEQLTDGTWVKRTYSHENDERLTAIEAKLGAIETLLNTILAKLTSGIPVKTVLSI